MRSPSFIIALFCLFAIIGCKNDKEEPGIELRNEVEEVKDLTDSGEIEDFFDDLPEENKQIYNLQLVKEFYEENEFEPIWNNRELREDLFRNIESIEEEGLFYEDYHGEELQKLLSSFHDRSFGP